MEHRQEKECTSKCRSTTHAKLIQSCVVSATPSQLRAYAVWLCNNFATVTDEFGRNILHTASSCGKWEVVEWLLKQCNIEIDLRDHESGWTSLHRSFFYGQLAAARILCMNGANLYSMDHEGLTPIDIILKDRLPYIEYLPSDPSEVYVWGSNFNYNLGLGNSQSRAAPEILEIFRKDFIDIQQVQICKFHTVFLTMTGKVYSCGYGHGGRLGQDSEDISLVPSLVKGLGSQPCSQVAAGQDHIIFLLQNGQVWSCGLNVYHQLGHIPPSEKVLSPKSISLKFLKGKKVIGVRAARFHSVIQTCDSIYTFGLNAGQLGHAKGDRTQIMPRQVSGLYAEGLRITHVEVSDGATICATNRGDIYVLHEYQIRKITSRQLEIQKLSVVGGHLDSRVDVSGVKEGGGLELRVALLANCGKVYLWRQTDPYLRRCLYTFQREIIISDIHINHYSVGLVTINNEAFEGKIVSYKGKRAAPPSSTVRAPTNFSYKTSCGLVALLDTDDCHFIKVKKLPNIYRATSITSDSKGRNFAVLQTTPKMGLIQLPWLSNSRIEQDFSRLLSETHVQDNFYDIKIKVDKREFAAHKYILASRCEFFRKKFTAKSFTDNVLVIENTRPEAFEQVLKVIYTNKCDFFSNGYEVNWGFNKENGKKKKTGTKTSKAANPVNILQELSRKLNMSHLTKRLESVKFYDNKVNVCEVNRLPDMFFKKNLLTNLSDVSFISSDGVAFQCHKCILIARLDYFHSMLNTCWAETANLEEIPLPIPSQVLEAILDYLYSDDSVKVTSSDDIEFVCQTLIFADQLIIPLLKEMCEVSLVRLITLKNCGELLEISSLYNAEQLKKSCMQFICLNLASVVESKCLDIISEDVIEELTIYYRNLLPNMHKRRLSSSNMLKQEDLISLEKLFPVSDTFSFEKSKLDCHENKTKNRRRCNSHRSELKDTSFGLSNLISSEIEVFEKNGGCKDIILNILTPDIKEAKEDLPSCLSPKENKYMKASVAKTDKLGQWIIKCPSEEQITSLDKIMQEEENKLTVLNKKTNILDMKPIPHLSQKQKKMTKHTPESIQTASSPPSRNSCPWAKVSEQSPPSPSFWDSFSKKEFSPSSLISGNETSTRPLTDVKKSQISSPENSKDVVISLHDIQKAEEQKFRRSINPQIKPLHLINIEDQAIEELFAMYKVNDNHKEKITVSRVQPEEVASPIWKKKY